MLLSLFWKRTNRYGALAGMIVGGVMVFVWKRERSKTGPNTAPKPAHANETKPNTDEFESQAISTPITEIAIRVTLATII